MIVKCPKCEQKFRIPDEQVKPHGIKVRCGRCTTVFSVRPAQEPRKAAPGQEFDSTRGVSATGVEPGPLARSSSPPPVPSSLSPPPLPIDRSPIPDLIDQAIAEEEPSANDVSPSSPLAARVSPPPAAAGSFAPSPLPEDFSGLGAQAPSQYEVSFEHVSGAYGTFPAPVSDAYPHAEERADRLSRWLASALVVLALIIGFFVYLAYRNDWMLDLEEMDQMVGVAFKGQVYQPRMMRTIRVYDLQGEIVEEEIANESVEEALPLEFRNLRQSLYRTRNQFQLVLIEGDLLNISDESYRRIFVGGQLSEGDHILAGQVAPVGGTLSPENLEMIFGRDELADLYQNLAGEVAGLVIHPNQLSRFTLVFIEPEGYFESDRWRYQVEVVQAEHSGSDGVWRRSTFNRVLSP